ncbi:MAG TPA: hypothetical protein DD618_04585 [Acholeplasmatales bacterium]|nr:hypothetical protein [Acholeplasmatales bacterium]
MVLWMVFAPFFSNNPRGVQTQAGDEAEKQLGGEKAGKFIPKKEARPLEKKPEEAKKQRIKQ